MHLFWKISIPPMDPYCFVCFNKLHIFVEKCSKLGSPHPVGISPGLPWDDSGLSETKYYKELGFELQKVLDSNTHQPCFDFSGLQ